MHSQEKENKLTEIVSEEAQTDYLEGAQMNSLEDVQRTKGNQERNVSTKREFQSIIKEMK